MSEKKTVAKNSSYLSAAYAVQKVFTFIYFMALSRVYGPSEQGLYSAAVAYVVLFGVLIDLGFAYVITRETARKPEMAGRYLAQSLMFRLVAGILVYGIIVGSALLAGKTGILLELIIMAGVYTILDMLSTACWATFRGLHNLKYESISVLVRTVLQVGIGGIAIYYHAPLHYLIVAIFLGSLFDVVFSFLLVRFKAKIQLVWKWDGKLLKHIAVLAIPFAVAAVASRIYTNADLVMLEHILGEEHAGWYSAVNKMVLALQVFPAALSAAIFPAMSTYYVTAQERIGKIYAQSTVYLLAFVIPAAVGILLLAEPIVTAVYQEQYLPSIPVLQVLTLALVGAFLIFPLGAMLGAIDKQKVNSYILSIAAAVNIALNLILIPSQGAVGAAIGSGATYVWILVASLWVAREYWKAHAGYLFLSLVKVSIASAIMGAGVYFLTPHIHVALNILIALPVFAISALALRVVKIKDLLQLYRGVIRKEKVA